MNRYLTSAMALLWCLSVAAQRRLVVIDAKTLEPIADVSVRPDGQRATKTNGKGHVEIAETFDSLTFSHVKYGRERLARHEVADTVALFSREVELPEVVVTDIGPDLRRSMRAAHERMVSTPRPSNLLSFDLGDLLDRRGRRDRKHLKKARKILQEYDLK